MDEALSEAYARYERAQGKADREELVTSRLALCVALMGTGWTAPDSVREQMRRDEKTLRRLRDVDTVDLVDPLRLPIVRPLATSPAS